MMIALRTIAIACMLGLLWHGSVSADEGQPRGVEQQKGSTAPTSESGRGFNPGEQRVVVDERSGTRVTLLDNAECATCANGSRLTFEMRTAMDEAPRRLVLDGPAQVDEIHVVDAKRALIVGQVQSGVGEVVVIDPRAATVIDRFVGFRPTISPDRTRIAYMKVFPLHFTKGMSAQYLVYDVTLPPSAMRHATVPSPPNMAGATLRARVNVGMPMYPPGAQNVPDDNYGLPEGSQHSLRSPFFWSADSKRLAFSDWLNGTQSIVVADLSAGLRNVAIRSHKLDSASIVRPHCMAYAGREGDAFTVSGVKFLNDEGTVVQLQFSFTACGGVKTLQVALD